MRLSEFYKRFPDESSCREAFREKGQWKVFSVGSVEEKNIIGKRIKNALNARCVVSGLRLEAAQSWKTATCRSDIGSLPLHF